MTIQADDPAEDLRIRRKPVPPDLLAQHSYGTGTGMGALVGEEEPAELGPIQSINREEIAGNQKRAHVAGNFSAKRGFDLVPGCEIAQGLSRSVLAIVRERHPAKLSLGHGGGGVLRIKAYEAVRVSVYACAKQHSIDYSENAGI